MSKYDKIITSSPIDKSAALSLSKGGEAPLKATRPNHHFNSLAPDIKLREPKNAELVSSTWEDLRGRKFGWFTVIGIVDRQHKTDRPAQWLCRCLCGYFETRSARAIRNPKNDIDRCIHCRKDKWVRESYGRNRNSEAGEENS